MTLFLPKSFLRSLIGLCWLCGTLLWASNPTQTIQSQAERVTVFLNGAQVYHTAKVNLSSGNTELVLTNLPIKLSDKSLKFVIEGASLLSVSVRYKPLLSYQISKPLEDSIKILSQHLESLKNEMMAYDTVLSVLSKNKAIGGQQTGVPIEQLRQATDFYFNKHKEIANRKMELRQQISDLEVKVAPLINRRSDLYNIQQRPNKEAVLMVQSTTATTAQILFNYLVADAQWQPSYNIRATDTENPIIFEYEAQVYKIQAWIGQM